MIRIAVEGITVESLSYESWYWTASATTAFGGGIQRLVGGGITAEQALHDLARKIVAQRTAEEETRRMAQEKDPRR